MEKRGNKLLFYVIQMHGAGSKARKQIKRKKKIAFLAHKYLYFFPPPPSLNPVRKLGQSGAILSSPASTTLLTA